MQFFSSFVLFCFVLSSSYRTTFFFFLKKKSGQWLAYLRDLLTQARECYRVKVMLVGRENVGKTSVLRCLRRNANGIPIEVSGDDSDDLK